MHDLNEIKAIRRKLGLTQTELAQKAGVSQSLIAKIESGKMDPTYTRTRKIFETLDLLAKGKSLKARDIMNRKVISVLSSSRLLLAVRKMRKEGISQLPVLEDGRVAGMVTEALLLSRIMEEGPEGRLNDVMGEAPPTVSGNTDIDAVAGLLRHFPLVLVVEKGKIRGLITKSDILDRYVK